MYLRLPGVRVHVTCLFAAFLALALSSGSEDGGVLIVSALLHECGHLAFLLSYGCRGLTLELCPGGARIRGAGWQALPYGKALVCVLAGPAVNLLLAGAAFVFMRRLPGAVFTAAVRVNASLAFFNLLPLSFLDGGRALKCAAAMLPGALPSARAARRADLVTLAFLAGGTVFLLSHGKDAFLPAVFTAYCAAQCLRRKT